MKMKLETGGKGFKPHCTNQCLMIQISIMQWINHPYALSLTPHKRDEQRWEKIGSRL